MSCNDLLLLPFMGVVIGAIFVTAPLGNRFRSLHHKRAAYAPVVFFVRALFSRWFCLDCKFALRIV